MAVKKTIDINKFVLEKLKNKSINTDTIIRDPNTSYGWDLRALIKEFINGNFIHREDIKKKKQMDRFKISDSIKLKIKKLFLRSFTIIPTINGAIEFMIKRDDKGNYPFKKLSLILKKKNRCQSIVEEKKLLEDQVRRIIGKLKDIRNYFRDENFFHIEKLNSYEKLDSEDIESLKDLIRMKVLTKEEIDTFYKKTLKL